MLLMLDYAGGSNDRTQRVHRVFSLCRMQVHPGDPEVKAPGSSQLSSKRFPSRRSNLLPSDVTRLWVHRLQALFKQDGLERKQREHWHKEGRWQGSAGGGFGHGGCRHVAALER